MKYKIKLSTVTTYKFGGYCNNFYKISNNDIDLFDDMLLEVEVQIDRLKLEAKALEDVNLPILVDVIRHD